MKIVISPAKSLDFEKPLPTQLYSDFCFVKEANAIHKVLKKKEAPAVNGTNGYFRQTGRFKLAT